MWSLCCIYSLGYWLAKVSAAPTELILLLLVFPQGSISGFALISPWAMQECRPCRALCRIGRLRCCGIVFVKCVWGVNGFLRSFVFLYLIDCIVCDIGGIVCGIDCCVRAMSPKGAILLHSPGRKPWVRCVRTYFEPL